MSETTPLYSGILWTRGACGSRVHACIGTGAAQDFVDEVDLDERLRRLFKVVGGRSAFHLLFRKYLAKRRRRKIGRTGKGSRSVIGFESTHGTSTQRVS